MTKEDVYDEQINPLMAKILAICKEHKIAMLASFAIPNDSDPALQCTSAMLGDDHLEGLPKDERASYLAALQLVQEGFVAFTTRARLASTTRVH